MKLASSMTVNKLIPGVAYVYFKDLFFIPRLLRV